MRLHHELVGALSPRPAEAAFITFNDRSAWLSALTGTPSLENFDSIVADTVIGGGLNVGALTLSTSSLAALVDTAPYQGGATGINGTSMLNASGMNRALAHTLTIALPGPFTAFGFAFENFDQSGDFLTVIVGGQVATALPTAIGKGFIGIVSDAGAFSSVLFDASQTTGGGNVFNAIDDVEWGDVGPAATVPEPSSLALLSLGGAVLRLARRRKQRSA